MVCLGHDGFGEVLHQVFFGGEGSGTALRHQSDAMAHAEYMRVYRHGRLVEHHALNHIRRLSSHPRQFYQLLECARHFAIEIPDQHLCHAHQVLRLVVGIAHASDVLENHFRSGGSQCFGRREIME